MTIKNILTLASLFTASMMANGQTQPSLIGFQDIPWGSSVQIVRSKFPQVKAWDGCKNASSVSEATAREQFKKLDQNCVSYSIEKYTVDNADFN